MICRACGGGAAHHAVTVEEDADGCWCNTCRELPVEQRCRSFDPVDARKRFARSAKKANASRAQLSLPREGTFKRQVYDFIASSGLEGLTRPELEYKTAKSADAVAGAVVGLHYDGLIEHSGHERALDLMSKEQPAWRVKN